MLAFIDSVLIQFGVCLVPGVMNDILFKPGHLGYSVIRLWTLFKPLMLASDAT